MAAKIITISLRKRLVKIHTSRRQSKAMDYLKEAVARHSKSDIDSVKINQNLNEYIGANTTNRYRPIKVSVNKVGEVVEAEWAEAPKKVQPAAAKSAKVVSPAPTAQGKAPGAATTAKAVTSIQKEVSKEISKKVEEKKAEGRAETKKKEQSPKKEDRQKGAPA